MIDAELTPRPIQRIRIDPLGAVTDPLVDLVLLGEQVGELVEHWKNQSKGKLLAARVGNAVGSIADGKLSLQSIPRVIGTRSFLRIIAAKAEAEGKTLLDVLLKMESVITVNKTALGKFMGDNDIDQLCQDGDPKLPSFTVKPTGTGGAPDAAAALRQLSSRQRVDPDLFKLPEKAPKPKPDPNAPRVAYVV